MRIAFPALGLALGLALQAIACGGSSSETPPPLEPDPTSARYTGPRLPSAKDDAAPAPAPEPDEDGARALPQKPGRSTWGSGRPAPSPAPALPSMTSPTALPPAPSPSGAPPSNF